MTLQFSRFLTEPFNLERELVEDLGIRDLFVDFDHVRAGKVVAVRWTAVDGTRCVLSMLTGRPGDNYTDTVTKLLHVVIDTTRLRAWSLPPDAEDAVLPSPLWPVLPE